MKLTTGQYTEPQKDRGISRMVTVSAVLHVVAIILIIISTKSYREESPPPRLASHSVELVGPAALAKRGPNGRSEKTSLASSSPVEKDKRDLPQTQVPPKPAPAVQQPEEPKREEQLQPRTIEPASVKPQEVVKAPETPKAKEPPVAKAKEPAKVVPTAKVVPKEPPIEKRKEEVKPKEIVSLPEKKEKPKAPLQTKPEPARPTEKKPEVKKTETKPELAKTTEKEPDRETAKSAKRHTEASTLPVKVPPAGVMPSKAARDTDVREREQKIMAAVESVRAREEAASRDKEITSAIERIRQNAKGTGDDAAGEKMDQRRSAHEGEGAKESERGNAHGLEFLTYTENIKQRVKDGWILPERRPGLTTIIRFAVEADGQVVDVELIEPSGDRAFDQSALRAVKKANPLPPPPSAYREEFVTQKVEITFSGEERVN